MSAVFRSSLLLFAGLLSSGPALSLSVKLGVLHSTHGDWDIYCADGVDREQACSASTSVSVMGGGVVGLSVDKVRGSREIRLSIALSPGLRASAAARVSLGGEARLTFPDFDCGTEYCLASLKLPADRLVRMRAEDSATVSVPRRWGRTLKTEISLDGFGEAFDDLP